MGSGRAWRFRGVGFHCLLLTCVRPHPCVCMCACICVSTWFCEGTYSYVWFCTAEKWNQCSPRDSTILSLSTITWALQIKRVPHHVRPPRRPAVSVAECALFCSNSYSHTSSRNYNHLRFKLMYDMLTVTDVAHEESKTFSEEFTAAQEANVFGPQWHFTASCQFWAPFCQHTPTFQLWLLGICCSRWLMQTNPWHKDRPQWSMGSAFQEQQEGLTMKLVRLLPFCAEALKRRHSASFFSSSPRWGFFYIENCSTVWEHTEQIVWWAADWLIDDFVCQGVAKAARVLH